MPVFGSIPACGGHCKLAPRAGFSSGAYQVARYAADWAHIHQLALAWLYPSGLLQVEAAVFEIYDWLRAADRWVLAHEPFDRLPALVRAGAAQNVL